MHQNMPFQDIKFRHFLWRGQPLPTPYPQVPTASRSSWTGPDGPSSKNPRSATDARRKVNTITAAWPLSRNGNVWLSSTRRSWDAAAATRSTCQLRCRHVRWWGNVSHYAAATPTHRLRRVYTERRPKEAGARNFHGNRCWTLSRRHQRAAPRYAPRGRSPVINGKGNVVVRSIYISIQLSYNKCDL